MNNKVNDSSILVSILITNYNGEKFIDKSLESVVNQTYKNIEIIVGDDASTDGSVTLIKRWQKIDPRIKLLVNKENKGIGYQRNNLIANAKGQYFCFLDGDDFYNPRAVESLIRPVYKKRHDIDIISGKVWWQGITEEKQIVKWKMPFFVSTWMFRTKNDAIKYIRRNLGIVFHGVLFNKKYYDSLNYKFDEHHIFEDIGSMIYIFLKAKTFYPVNYVCYNYVRRKNSLSNFKTMNFKQIHDALWQFDNILKILYKEKMLYKKKYMKAIMSWFCGIGFLILQLEGHAKKINSENLHDVKLIFSRYKYQFLYLIFIKYRLDIEYRCSWWKFIIKIFMKIGFMHEMKAINNVRKK